MSDGAEELGRAFGEAVDTTRRELERWLETDESRALQTSPIPPPPD